jgi:hypothetical protein
MYRHNLLTAKMKLDLSRRAVTLTTCCVLRSELTFGTSKTSLQKIKEGRSICWTLLQQQQSGQEEIEIHPWRELRVIDAKQKWMKR